LHPVAVRWRVRSEARLAGNAIEASYGAAT
jgi:hypothetical protein